MQWFNLLSTRTRRLSIFTQSPFGRTTGNWYLFPAMAISLCVGMCASSCPSPERHPLTRRPTLPASSHTSLRSRTSSSRRKSRCTSSSSRSATASASSYSTSRGSGGSAPGPSRSSRESPGETLSPASSLTCILFSDWFKCVNLQGKSVQHSQINRRSSDALCYIIEMSIPAAHAVSAFV